MISPNRRALALTAALLAGCAEPAPPPPGFPAPPSAPAPVDPRSLLQLPFSTSRGLVPTGVPVVLISRQAIVVQGDEASTIPLPPDPSRGADAAYKRAGPHDYYLVPLAAALERSPLRGAGALAIGADAAVPYRVLAEVLYTAGLSGMATLHLLVRTAAGPGAIQTQAPKIVGARPRSDVPALNLAVVLVRDGISVKTSGGNIAPGCSSVGLGLTFPRGPGGLDLAGLQACAAAARNSDPRFAAETLATLVANPDITFGELVAVMDALRTEPSGRPGFPDIAFGILR
jgi:hypothetical protein